MGAAIPKGYVFIARDILASTLWQRRPEDRVVAITCIMIANHQMHKWWDGRSDVTIVRGQFARSWPSLSRECRLSPKVTRTSVDHLAKVDFLTRREQGRYSVYGIQKYGIYQDRDRYGREKTLPDGAIILARKILESSLWKMSAQDRVVAITCLLVANYAAGTAEIGGREVRLERGQFLASWDKLAGWCRLPVEETQESMARLTTGGFITKDTVDGIPIFNLPNYGHYQDPSKYVEGPRKPGVGAGAAVPAAFETPNLPFPDLPSPAVPAGHGQHAGRSPAGARQDAGRSPAANKNLKNLNKGEEGGSAPTPVFQGFEARGAPPPLAPALELAEAYQKKFPKVMGLDKALNQATLFLGRGGRLQEGLEAIQADAGERTLIWKILDPLVDQKRSVLDDWIPPERRTVSNETRDVQSGP